MTNLDLTLFFAQRLLVMPEDPDAFRRLLRRTAVKKCKAKNKDSVLQYNRAWNKNNRARKRQNDANWRKNNPGASYAWCKASRKKNPITPVQAVRNALRSRLHDCITKKSAGTAEFVGCSWEHLVAHIERQFKPGMSWKNRNAWHIDHIRPCASFDLSDPAQQLACFHYTNLQPLWVEENLAKGAKWEGK